jgi:Kef-type K+ transport system membrane component KefB
MFLVVVLSKLLGAAIGTRFGGFSNQESVQLGFGMLPRGEVVLILGTIGIAEGFIDGSVFSMVVALVVLTTLVTPPILKRLFVGSQKLEEIC